MSSVYLKEASVTELLDEIAKRFKDLDPVPEWAAPIVFSVATFYGVPAEQLRSRGRQFHLAKARQLAISIMAQLHPTRTRAEVCAIMGVEHHMYVHSIKQTEDRVARFADFRREVTEVMRLVRETSAAPGGMAAASCGSATTTRPDAAAAS